MSGSSNQRCNRAAILIPAAPPPTITIFPFALLEKAFACLVSINDNSPAAAIILKNFLREIPFFSKSSICFRMIVDSLSMFLAY